MPIECPGCRRRMLLPMPVGFRRGMFLCPFCGGRAEIEVETIDLDTMVPVAAGALGVIIGGAPQDDRHARERAAFDKLLEGIEVEL